MAKTWIDRETNLEWECGSNDEMNWEEAMEYAKTLGEGWRVPSIKELLTLVDYEKFSPAIKDDINFMDSSFYWSSTTYAYRSHNAWSVYFYDGYVHHGNKTNSFYVRCVRGATLNLIKQGSE